MRVQFEDRMGSILPSSSFFPFLLLADLFASSALFSLVPFSSSFVFSSAKEVREA